MFTGFAIRTTSCQTAVSVIYIFPFVPDSFLIEHLKLFLWHSQFFSEFELRFSRNYCVIIPFRIEWPDRTSQLSMETVALVLFETKYLFFLEKTFQQILKSYNYMHFSILDSFTIFNF